MNQFKSIILVLVLIFGFGCTSRKPDKEPVLPQNKPVSKLEGSFSISGAYALYPLIIKLRERKFLSLILKRDTGVYGSDFTLKIFVVNLP